MDEHAIAAALARIPGWTRAGRAITRAYRFDDFRGALAFVNRISQLAEAEQHHPDIDIRYNQVTLSMWTHDAGGLSERDFRLAAAIDAGAGRPEARTRAAAALPTAFGDFFSGLVEERGALAADDAFHRCFGCGPAHPSGLRVRCFRTDDGVASPIVVPRVYEGPPGAVHGGIVAAYLDEVLGGAAACAAGRPAVTGELTVRYVKPVPSETPLLGRARLVANHGRYVDVEGSLEEWSARRVVATARGRFFPVELPATRG